MYQWYKRLTVGLTAVLLLLAFSGCGKEPVKDPASSTASEISAPEQNSSEPTSTVDPSLPDTTSSAPSTKAPETTTTTSRTTTTTTTQKPPTPSSSVTAPTTKTQTPANDIGATKQKAEFTVTLQKVSVSGGDYVVEMTVTCGADALDPHELIPKERLFLVDATRHRCEVAEVVDAQGESLLGKTLAQGGTQFIRAVFHPDSGFVPVEFQYVFDTRGFRDIRFSL